MFTKGQEVVCVDHKMGDIGAILEKDRLYHILEFISPEECEKCFPDDLVQWHKEGGRVELQELKGCYWFGRRFKA